MIALSAHSVLECTANSLHYTLDASKAAASQVRSFLRRNPEALDARVSMRRSLFLLLVGSALHCAPTPVSQDAAVDAVAAETMFDAADAAPILPPGTPLPPVSYGDLRLEALSNGGFSLRVGTREVLASPGGAVAAQQYDESVRFQYGLWTFRRGAVREWRPALSAVARVENEALVLETNGEASRSVLRFTRASPGEVLVRASVTAPERFASTALRFTCRPDAHFLGFGEQYNDLDHRGRSFGLFVSEQGIGRDPARGTLFSGTHETTYFPVPFFLDPRAGLGVAIETDARVVVDLCREDPAVYTLAPEQNEEVTLRLYTGPTPAEVLRDWTVLQGRTSTPPAWSVEGVWLGIQGGPAAVRGALARARAANIPVGALWAQDWVGRREFGMGNVGVRYRWSVDEQLYPDLAGLTRELHQQGVRFLGYFNPFLVPEQDLYEPALSMGFVPRTPQGQPYQFTISVLEGSTVDFTHPMATPWFRSHARAALQLGLDGWMQDFGEWLPIDARLHDGRNARTYHNRYPLDWHNAARLELDAQRPNGDYILLTRSGWLRESRVAQVVWAGDQECTFSEHDGLPTVVPAMVSLGMVGVGFVTHDVAGFSGGPSTKELYQRWVELAAFTPIFRTHEGLRRAENWSWDRDEETRTHFSRFARVHQALAPRLLELGAQHRATGMPLVRALPLQFPDDERTYTVKDQYLLGDDLLVAPVLSANTTERRVYFPRGRWFDVWDPTRMYDGPGERMVSAPIGRPPVFSSQPRMDLAAIR